MDRYPVIIETRMSHVVWIEAENPAAAVEDIEISGGADLDQLTDLTNLIDADWEVRAPDDPDWGAIRDHEPPADAHVRLHKAHQRELARADCAAAGHPEANRHRYGDDVIECDLCRVVIAADVEAVAV